MTQNAEIALARRLYQASELATKQVVEAQSLAKDMFQEPTIRARKFSPSRNSLRSTTPA